MTVTLLHNSPLHLAAHGARTCWDSHDKSDTAEALEKAVDEYLDHTDIGWEAATDFLKPLTCGTADAALVDRVGNKFKHASILEHLNYAFFIEGISRACLQELSRHRHTSPSVKSSRYTLKELREEEGFCLEDGYILEEQRIRASRYLVMTTDSFVNETSIRALEGLRNLIVQGISNDLAKYAMPESYKVTEQLTINARSLQNFLSLRSDKAALWEIRDLAHAIYNSLPEDHKFLFTDHIKD
jgi:thymidylate synthase (FAD)